MWEVVTFGNPVIHHVSIRHDCQNRLLKETLTCSICNEKIPFMVFFILHQTFEKYSIDMKNNNKKSFCTSNICYSSWLE